MKFENPIPKAEREKIKKRNRKADKSASTSFEVMSQIVFNGDYMGFTKDVIQRMVGLETLDYDTFKTDSALSLVGMEYDSLNRRYICQEEAPACEAVFKVDAEDDVCDLMVNVNDVNPNGNEFTKYYVSNNNVDWQEVELLDDISFDDPNKTVYLKVVFEEDAESFSSDFFISEYALRYNYC